MKRTHKSSSQSTSVIFVFVIVVVGLTRVKHAAGTSERGGGSQSRRDFTRREIANVLDYVDGALGAHSHGRCRKWAIIWTEPRFAIGRLVLMQWEALSLDWCILSVWR